MPNVRFAWLLGLLRPRPAQDVTEVPAAGTEDAWNRRLAAFLCELGRGLLQAGAITSEVGDTLADVAARHGVRASAIVAPTGLFVRVGGEGNVVDFLPVTDDQLRLDQVQALYKLVARLRARVMPIDEALAELRAVQTLPPRMSPVASIAGYSVLTVGLGLLQHPTPVAVAGWAALGAAVGVLRMLATRFPVLATALPVVVAAVVTFVALRWAGPLLHMRSEELLIPPLIAFLPGSALTMGTIELAKGAALSGVARLAGAANVLLLLAFGILVGGTLAGQGYPSAQSSPGGLGGWAPWLGVLLLGVGFLVFYSARPRVLPWLLACLLVERLAQVGGTWLAGAAFGAFCAGLTIPLVAALVERRTETPAQVLFLPSFWMLVPGAVGLTGVSELVAGHDASGLDDLLQTLITMVSITLGVLVGASLLPRERLRVADVSRDHSEGKSPTN